MSTRPLIVSVLAALAVLVPVVAWQATRPQPAKPGDTYLPKAAAGDKVAPAVAPVTTEPHHADSPQVELDLDQLALLTTGQLLTGRARSTDETVTYILKGKQSGQIAGGTLSVPGSGSEMKQFALRLSFDKDPVSGDQGILQLTVNTPDGPASVVREVQLP